MVSIMLYPCIFRVALLMNMFVLCVACFAVFVNCLMKQFTICFGVVVILLLKVMEVLRIGWRGNECYISSNESDETTHLSLEAT